MSDTADFDRRIELERSDAARQALERAAMAIESKPANSLYRAAFKVAAKVIRSLKPC